MEADELSPTGEAPVHPEAQVRVAQFALVIALALMALIPFLSSTAPPDKGWYLSPRNLPILGLGLMAIAAFVQVRDGLWLKRHSSLGPYSARAASAFAGFRGVIVYTVLFALYVYAMGWIGFTLSTWIFGQVCLWVAGLRSAKWWLWNFCFVAILTLSLRVLMGLWFPLPPLMQLLPAWFTNSVGIYL